MDSRKGSYQVDQRLSFMYCLPALGLILLLVVLPFIRTFYFSLTDTRLSTLDNPVWVGLRNFLDLFQDPDWWTALKNTLGFTAVSVFLETALGLLFALAIQKKFPGIGLLRASILIPWAIPAVISAKIWAWMFNDLFGIINEVLIRLSLIHDRLAWLADPQLTFVTWVTVDVWKTTPFMAILLLAGLQSIPESVLEAADLDGASDFQKFIHIKLPLLLPSLWIAILFRTLDALRIFDLPYVLGSNSKSTAVLSTFVRQQLVDFQEIGYGSAASVLVFCVIGLVSVAYILLSKRYLGVDE